MADACVTEIPIKTLEMCLHRPIHPHTLHFTFISHRITKSYFVCMS